MINPADVERFVTESNQIEGIFRPPTAGEISAHTDLWNKDHIVLGDVVEFVQRITSAPLRSREGMTVVAGNHVPPPGGPDIAELLTQWLREIQAGNLKRDPYQSHARYEQLHPFMDGNGRSGRALWAWHMMKLGRDPFVLPFLQLWYYATLDSSFR